MSSNLTPSAKKQNRPKAVLSEPLFEQSLDRMELDVRAQRTIEAPEFVTITGLSALITRADWA